VCSLLTLEREKASKESKKSLVKEKNLETNHAEVTFKVKELTTALNNSQAAVKTLTTELEKVTTEYRASENREQLLQQSEDGKLRILLAKVKALDDELVTVRWL
jgi:chromosome segregation ATPase